MFCSEGIQCIDCVGDKNKLIISCQFQFFTNLQIPKNYNP